MPSALENNTLFVITGPSGVGKGTVCKSLLQRFPELTLSISMTSRSPRANEQPGRDYHFVSRSEFEALIQQGAFLEWAEYNRNYYGTPKQTIDAELGQGRSVLLEIDTQGAKQVKESAPNASLIFIEPPSLNHLAERLRSRGTNSEEDIQNRLHIAQEEVTQKHQFDFTVINDSLESCVEAVATWIQARLHQQVPTPQ